MANIGQQLLTPEAGWRRFDDTDSNISYVGTWTDNLSSSYYNGSTKYSITNNASIKFNFTGTKLRFIGRQWNSLYSTNISVKIDDVLIGEFSQLSSQIYQTLDFEKTGLSNKEHYVEITNTQSGKYIIIDAIDIESTGILKPYNNKLNRYLIQQGEGIYSIKSSFYNKVGQSGVDENMFLNYGADDLSALTIPQTQNTSIGVDDGILGSGKYFSIPFNTDYQSINTINIS